MKRVTSTPHFVALLFLLFGMSTLSWANIEYDQDITPDAIYGNSGNVKGNFTTFRADGIEIGLKAKIPGAGILHSTGDGRYHYSLAETDHDNDSGTANRWQFDWAINTDFDGSSGSEVGDYTYELGLDSDPSEGVNYLKFDPIAPTPSQPFFDHSFGTNATGRHGGVEAGDASTYLNYLTTKNVVQQSWRYAFFPNPPLDNYDPSAPGTYNVYLLVKNANGTVIGRSEIVVVIGGLTFEGEVTPDAIYGNSGNVKDDFTIDRKAAVEVGLKAKIPGPGIMHNNGDGTYQYTLAETDHDNDSDTANRWQFDWAVNTNYDSSATETIGDYSYEIGLDADPGLGTDYLIFDPVTPTALTPFFDHSFGTNATGRHGGVEAGDASTYLNYLDTKNVVQQSWRYAFFDGSPPMDSYNPDVPGTYSVYLSVKDSEGAEIARSEIQVLIEGAPANTTPHTAGDYYVTNENENRPPINVLDNDTDADGQTLSVVNPGNYTAKGSIGGDILIESDGTTYYFPTSPASGVATFDFLVTDGTHEVGSELTITVRPVNDAPNFSIGGDVLVSSLTDNNELVVFNNFTTNYVFGPADESGQSVEQFNVNVSSDSDAVIQQAFVTNDGFLVVEFTTNLGTAILDISMQDDGGTANGGVDTSAIQSFSVSFLDIIFMNGFEVENEFSILNFIEDIKLVSADKNFALYASDKPYYDYVTDSVYFLNHRFSLHSDYSDKPLKNALVSWMKEVISKDNLPIVVVQ